MVPSLGRELLPNQLDAKPLLRKEQISPALLDSLITLLKIGCSGVFFGKFAGLDR